MSDKELAIIKLREAVEAKIGNKPETNRDFENLSNTICDELHDRISPTTLKRIWGYLSEAVTPRHYTLNQLSRFVGYDNWDDFLRKTESAEEKTGPEDSSPATTDPIHISPIPSGRGGGRLLLLLLALVAFLAIAALFFFSQRSSSDTSSSDNPRILQKGQTFKTYDDFLPLFGITATESRHYQFIPGEEDIVVWSPQYHNPIYHNEGNPDSLMPTISEYWTPVKNDNNKDAVELEGMVHQRQKEAYYNFIGKKQVRIVFMKDLFDSTFVFLGVYRFDPQLSDTTKMVWIRAADNCDLDNIPFVKNYGNY